MIAVACNLGRIYCISRLLPINICLMGKYKERYPMHVILKMKRRTLLCKFGSASIPQFYFPNPLYVIETHLHTNTYKLSRHKLHTRLLLPTLTHLQLHACLHISTHTHIYTYTHTLFLSLFLSAAGNGVSPPFLS